MRIKRSRIRAVQAALNEAEAALQELGSGLLFLITPEGGVEIARRGETGAPCEPKEAVASLVGCDPILWHGERPEGPVTLGPPYREPAPRCALSGEALGAGAPLELYHRGRPLSPQQASRLAPLLTLVRGMVAAASSVLEELGGAAAQLGAIENGELRAIVADRLARDLAGRLTPGLGGAPLRDESQATPAPLRAEPGAQAEA